MIGFEALNQPILEDDKEQIEKHAESGATTHLHDSKDRGNNDK